MNRWRYLFRRILLSIPIVIFGVTMTFVILRMGPIDPAGAIIGPDGDPRARQAIREQLGLDQPLWQQYIDFMVDMFTFNLGQSWVLNPGSTVYEMLWLYAPRTIWLGFLSVLIAVCVGIPLGFYAGLNPNTSGDYAVSFGGIVWRAMPNFWLAVILVSLLSQSHSLIGLDWQSFVIQTPVVTSPPMEWATQWDGTLSLRDRFWLFVASTKMILPAALVLGSASMGTEMRIGRTAVLETVNSNYVQTAKAKGVPKRALIGKHIFRNSLIPLVPIITYEAFLLIGGSVLVETVFGINGLGYLFFQSAVNADLPMVGSLMFIFILMIVGINIVQDILYTLIDPRVGFEGGT